MNVSLPEKLKDKILSAVDAGNFSNPSEYVRSIVRNDLERRSEMERIKKLCYDAIREADQNNSWIEVTPEYWEDMRVRLRKGLAERRNENSRS